jgi:hypothetical protein
LGEEQVANNGHSVGADPVANAPGSVATQQRESEEVPAIPKALREALEERYILLTRNKLFAFLGGAIAFLVVVGAISWSVTLQAIREAEGKFSLDLIQREAEQAESNGKRIAELKDKAESEASYAIGVIDTRIARAEAIHDLKEQLASLQKQAAAAYQDRGGFGPTIAALARKQAEQIEAQIKVLESK